MDNAAYTVKDVGLVLNKLFATQHIEQYWPESNFHIRCIAHVFNLVVKECMGLTHSMIDKIGKC